MVKRYIRSAERFHRRQDSDACDDAKVQDSKSSTETIVYERISGEKSGLVGTWKPVSDHTDTPEVFTFRVTPEGALAYSGNDESFIVKPDAAQHRLNGDFTVSLKSSGEAHPRTYYFRER